ncbi:hypothetical protein ACIPWF_08165 [Paenarthrobacter sp. NPDC089989]|uniref:hypothetical protein n=1 Tax=unclassified Paenarthrobacter TaxID=2634190 RepID=UPI003822FDC7
MALKSLRIQVSLALAACVIPLMAACSGESSENSERRYIAKNFTELVITGLKDPKLQEFDRDVLERAKVSGRIEQADYDEAYSRFERCMAASGKPVKLTKLSNGLYKIENQPLSDGESIESAMSIVVKCQEGTINEIGELFGIQQGNPDLLADADEVAYNCLAAKGIVNSNFSKDDLKKAFNDPGNGKRGLKDRLPFDPYSDEAQACFVGANMAVGQGRS